MKLKTGIIAMGLAALVAAGCEEGQTNARSVGETITLTKPEGCEMIKDIRYDNNHDLCQLLCVDSNYNLVLYSINQPERKWNKWKKIEIKEYEPTTAEQNPGYATKEQSLEQTTAEQAPGQK